MRFWKEYNTNILEHFVWMTNRIKDANNFVVFSYNVFDTNLNKHNFWKYCKEELNRDIINRKQTYLYLIAREKIINHTSKVEYYKKCWKKLSEKYDINEFVLGPEVYHKDNNNDYYSGIAKIKISDVDKLLNILHYNSNKYISFISNSDYFDGTYNIGELILEFCKYDDLGDVDLASCLQACYHKSVVVCRYGTDSEGAEYSFIADKENILNFFSNDLISKI